MRLATVLLLAVALPAWFRDTNSHASAARGKRAYEEKAYDAAARAFARAQELAPSKRGAFNHATAEIAAGDREQGARDLEEAIRDPQLRADALFNRGNSALESQAFEHAIRDYSDALRADPNHAAAKRNLEIALHRKKNERPAPGGGPQQQKPNEPKPQPQPGQKPGPGNQPDLDALLRSVQQQEQEELRRMKGEAAEGKVGW